MPFKQDIEIRRSSIPNAGLGVYTTENIKKGDIVWYYKKDCVLELSLEQLNEIFNSNLSKFNEMLVEFMYYNNTIQKAIVDLDNTKYINHSYTPNTINNGYESIALRDIKKGEEIYENYLDYGPMPQIMINLHEKYRIWFPDINDLKDEDLSNEILDKQKLLNYQSSII